MADEREGEATVTPAVEGTCPFCGGKFSAGYADTPDEKDVPVLLHSKPHCAEYERLEINDYLAAVRRFAEGGPA